MPELALPRRGKHPGLGCRVGRPNPGSSAAPSKAQYDGSSFPQTAHMGTSLPPNIPRGSFSPSSKARSAARTSPRARESLSAPLYAIFGARRSLNALLLQQVLERRAARTRAIVVCASLSNLASTRTLILSRTSPPSSQASCPASRPATPPGSPTRRPSPRTHRAPHAGTGWNKRPFLRERVVRVLRGRRLQLQRGRCLHALHGSREYHRGRRAEHRYVNHPPGSGGRPRTLPRLRLDPHERALERDALRGHLAHRAKVRPQPLRPVPHHADDGNDADLQTIMRTGPAHAQANQLIPARQSLARLQGKANCTSLLETPSPNRTP